MRGHLLASALLSGLLLTACGSAPETAAPATTQTAPATPTTLASSAGELKTVIEGFIQSYFEYNPTFAANAGRHEFDGRLPDWSAGGLKAYSTWLATQRARLADFDDAALDKNARFQRDYVLAVIDGERFWLDDARQPFRNPAFYAGPISPSLYLTREYAPLPTRMAAFVAYQERLPAAAEQIRANLEAPLPAPLITYGIGLFGGLADYFQNDVPKAFASVADAELQKRFQAANEKAIAAMAGLRDGLKSQQPNATQNFALGAENFSKMLMATERVDTPLAELKAIGEADLARNRKALEAACVAFAPGASLPDCIAKEAASKPEGGAVSGARAQLAGLREFVVAHDIVTIPGPEQANVEEAPPFNRSNFAYIEIPGPYEKGLPSVYYIAPPDQSWPKAEQDAYVPGKADLLFTSVHEVWPGHFLQFLHANRADWLFGQLFVGYAFAEGWAHYTEEMMWDAGLGDGGSETHIGQLSNALLRNVRFLSAIGLHAGGMTVEESERMFREQALQDPGNARQQAIRGTYDPAYLNYTLGKLMILQLREDWTKTRGGRAGWKAFHDAFLAFGGPPIPLVRARMMNSKPEAVFYRMP